MVGRIIPVALALTQAFFLLAAEPAAAESPRIALVIGNSAYSHAPLANPVNDAILVADTLRGVGFVVLQHSDLTQKAMKIAVREFGDALEQAGADAVGLFYYSGHGIQVQGRNYMVPVNANIRRESDIDIEGVAADIVLGTMEFARNRLNLVIMDACRNNPFARSFRSATRGLARMDATKGMLIAYSTSPGKVAVDGEGNNSPYTLALAKSIQEPGVTVEQMFKGVRRTVMAETDSLQVPWESSSLTGDFYFSGPAAEAETPSKTPAQKATSNSANAEVVFWESIKDSLDPAMFEAYLAQFPNGVFAGLATIRGQQLAKLAEPVTRGSTGTQPTEPSATTEQSVATVEADGGEVSLSAARTVDAGAPLKLTWAGPDNKRDMITIVVADADQRAYGNYRYTKDGSPLELLAPDEPGDHEVRYLAGDGRATLAAIPIQVKAVSATLEAPSKASAGAEIRVEWEGPGHRKDFITIVELDADAGKYGKYRYARDGSPLKIQVPDTPGDYEIRYLTGQSRKTLASLPLRVDAASASIEAPATVAAGTEIKLSWEGPDNKKDFITIVEADADPGKYGKYTYTRDGSPLKLTAPDAAGDYEIRYLTGQSRATLVSVPILVEAVSASLEAPAEVGAGAEFKVHWEGPDNKKDFITVVETDADDRTYGNYTYTREGSPLKLLAPDEPGNYEIRYLTGQTQSTVASTPIEILVAEAGIEVPTKVPAGSKFKVTWRGPDNKRDFITIVAAETEERKYAGYTYTRMGNPLTLVAPDQPGGYEVRYLTAQTQRTLARQPITVE